MKLRNRGDDWMPAFEVRAAWHRGFALGVAVGVFVMLLALATV